MEIGGALGESGWCMEESGVAMLDLLGGLPLTELTASALLGLAILMILRGKIWTDAAYQEKTKESERWRLAYEAEREARQTSDAQTAELLELAKTTHSFIKAVFVNSERAQVSGDS